MTCPNYYTTIRGEQNWGRYDWQTKKKEIDWKNFEKVITSETPELDDQYKDGDYYKNVTADPWEKCSGNVTYEPRDMDDVCCPEPGNDYHEFICTDCKERCEDSDNDDSDQWTIGIDSDKYPQLFIDPVKIINDRLKEIE